MLFISPHFLYRKSAYWFFMFSVPVAYLVHEFFIPSAPQLKKIPVVLTIKILFISVRYNFIYLMYVTENITN